MKGVLHSIEDLEKLFLESGSGGFFKRLIDGRAFSHTFGWYKRTDLLSRYPRTFLPQIRVNVLFFFFKKIFFGLRTFAWALVRIVVGSAAD